MGSTGTMTLHSMAPPCPSGRPGFPSRPRLPFIYIYIYTYVSLSLYISLYIYIFVYVYT